MNTDENIAPSLNSVKKPLDINKCTPNQDDGMAYVVAEKWKEPVKTIFGVHTCVKDIFVSKLHEKEINFRSNTSKISNVYPFLDLSNTQACLDMGFTDIVYSDLNDRGNEFKISPQIERMEVFESAIDTNSIDSEKCLPSLKIPCLTPLPELKLICERMQLTFVDCSDDADLNTNIAFGQKYDHFLKNCSIKCLQSYEELGNLCEKINLKFNGKSYEVDLLIEDRFEGEQYYLVKWKNYKGKYSTWEPESNLIGCQDLVEYYNVVNRCEGKLSRKILDHFVKDLTSRKPYDYLTMWKLCALLSGTTETVIESMHFTLKELKLKVRELLNISHSLFAKIKGKIFKLMTFSEARKKVLFLLKEWEDEINTFNPSAYIEVENNVDLEEAPTDFKFIHDYIKVGIDVSEEPVAFCSCDNCFLKKQECCPNDSDGHFAYNRHGRLLLLPGYPIFECNKLCKCGPDCINRVVQHGQKIKVSIFRTSNGCGWGLKTLETIQKDQFVLEYLGEIITSEAAEARGKVYDCVGRSYLFDLDFNSENNLYTVDAGHAGNAAHFINHSCSPNLHVFAVWINQSDPYLPRLAFFSKRKIYKGEELTFDYKMVKNYDQFESSSNIPPEERIPCKCNSKNCRKFLY